MKEPLRQALLYLLFVWVFSTYGYLIGAKPLDEIPREEAQFFNLEASFRAYLAKSDDMLIRMLDFIYRSPVETWWERTKSWSAKLVLAIHKVNDTAALKSLREWYNADPVDRVAIGQMERLSVEYILEKVTELKEAEPWAEALEMFGNSRAEVVGGREYDPDDIKWSLGIETVPAVWEDVDPLNRRYNRNAYTLIAMALKPGADIAQLGPEVLDRNVTRLLLRYHRRSDLKITDIDLDKLPNNPLVERLSQFEPRNIRYQDVLKAIAAMNLYLQTHDDNVVGWMSSMGVRRPNPIMLRNYDIGTKGACVPNTTLCLG